MVILIPIGDRTAPIYSNHHVTGDTTERWTARRVLHTTKTNNDEENRKMASRHGEPTVAKHKKQQYQLRHQRRGDSDSQGKWKVKLRL